VKDARSPSNAPKRRNFSIGTPVELGKIRGYDETDRPPSGEEEFFLFSHQISTSNEHRWVWMIGHAAVRGNYNIARIRTIIYLLKRLDHYLNSAFFHVCGPLRY